MIILNEDSQAGLALSLIAVVGERVELLLDLGEVGAGGFGVVADLLRGTLFRHGVQHVDDFLCFRGHGCRVYGIEASIELCVRELLGQIVGKLLFFCDHCFVVLGLFDATLFEEIFGLRSIATEPDFEIAIGR